MHTKNPLEIVMISRGFAITAHSKNPDTLLGIGIPGTA